MMRIVSLLSVVFLLFSLGVATPNEQQSQQLSLTGRIVDSSGKPLPTAKATLVPGADYSRSYLFELDPGLHRITGNADDTGHFSVAFRSDDTRFLAGIKLALIVEDPQHQTQRLNIDLSRIQAGVPLEDVQLAPAVQTKIQVRSHDGKPLQGVQVYAAVQQGKKIPFAVACEQSTEVTDADGSVRIPQSDPGSLEGVFVVGPTVGNHRLNVLRSPTGELHVELPITRAVNGEITCPAEEAIPGVSSTRLFAFTLRSGSIYSQPSLQCSWQIAQVSKQGTFDIPAIALGDLAYSLICPADFPYRASQLDSVDLVQTLVKGDTPQEWRIRFKKQTQLRATILEASTKKPLQNICIATHDGRYQVTFTDEQGKASFYRTIDHVSYFPQDTLGEYFLGQAFYQDSNSVPVDGVIELEPMSMQKRLAWKGKTVDQDGHPIPAAKIVYTYSLERFTQSEVTYSDGDGHFRLAKISPKTAIKIRAEKGNAASELKSLVFPTKDAFELKLTQRTSLRPSGRLLDLRGNPIAGVSVKVMRGTVMIKEGYNSEELRAQELYDPPESALTDADGRFLFPATINFQHKLQVQVADPNCFPYHSSFVDFSKLDDAKKDDKLDMGDFKVMRRPQSRTLHVVIQSSTGAPIHGAEVVAIGARTGTQRGNADANGQVHLDFLNGKSVLAVSAEGYRAHFAEVPDGDKTIHVVLRSASDDHQERGNAIGDLDPQLFSSAAEEVFQVVPAPDLAHSTPHRMMTYLSAQAAIDPISFIKTAKTKGVGQYSGMASSSLTENKDLVEHAIDQKVVEGAAKGEFLLQAASKSGDPALQEDWVGEAIVASRGISSAMQRGFLMSTISASLLSSGRVEDAKRLMKDVWQSASDLHEVIESGERKKLTGESRGVGPLLAIIDLKKSHELIRLIAREIEIDSLLTEARLYRAQAYPEEFAKQLEDGALSELSDRGVDGWLRRVSRFNGMLTNGIPQPEKAASLIADPKVRLAFVLLHARTTEDLGLRDRLMQLAVGAIRQASSNSADDHFLFHFTGKMLPELRKFDSIEPQFLDQLVFATLWNMPAQFEGDRYQTVLAGSAQILAFRDQKLAKTLLEPAYGDLGWLFMGRQLNLTRNSALNAVAGVDPRWSVEVVDRICNEMLKHDPVDQLELRAGVAKALIDVTPKK